MISDAFAAAGRDDRRDDRRTAKAAKRWRHKEKQRIEKYAARQEKQQRVAQQIGGLIAKKRRSEAQRKESRLVAKAERAVAQLHARKRGEAAAEWRSQTVA